MKSIKQPRTSKKVVAEMAIPEASVTSTSRSMSKAPLFIFLFLFLVVSLGVVVAKKNKSLFVAGKVNGQFITRLELEKAMNDRYAKTVFDDLASTTLLAQLAAKNGVVATDQDLKKEVSDTETRLGGKEALNSTLDRMGYTQARFTQEMKMLVLEKKLAEKMFKAEVTEADVSKFFTDNKTLFPNKKLEEVKADIKNNLVSQKLQQQFTTWFQEEKGKAAIKNYL